MADSDLIVKITAETQQALKALGALNDELDDLVDTEKKSNKQQKTTQKTNKKTATSYKQVGIGIKSVVASLAALGVATKAIEFEKLAEDAEQSSEAFKLLFEDMGLVAEEEFNKIKEASKDLISDADIKQSAVTAASLGVPIEALAGLMEVARVKAREMGTTTADAFRDIAIGIGRGSPMILDNLGLTIKLEDAYKKYAEAIGTTTDKLSKEQKQMALTQAVVDAGADSIERFKDAGLSAAQESQRLDTQLKNLKINIGTQLIPVMNKLKTVSADWLEQFDSTEIQKVTDNIVTVGKALGAVNDYLVPDLGKEGRGLLDTIAEGYGKILEHMTLFAKFSDTINLSEGVQESKEDIDEFIKSLADFGTESDVYKGKLSGIKDAYNEQATELGVLLKQNQDLQRYFRETNADAFVNELKQLGEEEQKIIDQSVTLGETYKTIFDGDTATKTNENTEAVKKLREELGSLNKEAAVENEYVIKPKTDIDKTKTTIEISNALGDVEKKLEIKPTVKVDEKETEKEVSESVKNAIQKIGDDAKTLEVIMQIDESSKKKYIDTMDNLTQPEDVDINLELQNEDKIQRSKADIAQPIYVPVYYYDAGGGQVSQDIQSSVADGL